MNDQMNDAATVTGKAWAPLAVGGKTHRVYPLTYDDLGELQAWVNAQLPDPFDAVASSPGFARLSVEAQKYAIRCAVELAAKGKRRLNSPEAAEAVNSPEGVAFLLYLMVKRGDPTFTEAAAAELVRQVTPQQVASLQATAYGVEPAAAAAEAINEDEAAERLRAEGVEPGPKGRAPRTGGGSTTRSAGSRSTTVPRTSAG
jgi:hypothetical protein